ncbi:EVE domain-containing protein [Pendulispora brunnea]|uniref:EVE domain-containing protein n=1 Tax=Pendulispora brunnea TaxID=2905690 RepID=A0ABZ2KHY6_9BACT
MSAWLIKSEPSVYPFSKLVSDKKTVWDGVRNFEARNNLRKMKKGDICLFYHSNEGKAVVGIARVVKEAYSDPSSDDGEDWSVVEVAPVKELSEPVTLERIKAHPDLSDMALVRRSRLSVTPVTEAELRVILREGKTKL